MRWGRLSSGLILAATSGITFGHAWSVEDAKWWWIGSMTLLAAVLFILSALYHPQEVSGAPPAPVPPARTPQKAGVSAPMLGEMLLRRAMISQENLDRALAEQKGSKRRLGEILVEMNLITHAELAQLLEEQLAEREGRFAWR